MLAVDCDPVKIFYVNRSYIVINSRDDLIALPVQHSGFAADCKKRVFPVHFTLVIPNPIIFQRCYGITFTINQAFLNATEQRPDCHKRDLPHYKPV